MNKAVLSLTLLFLINPLLSLSQTDYWEHTNGPHAGTIYDYSFGENDFVYAAADNGVYKSTDNGETWSNIGLTGKFILSVCKLRSGTLLAAEYNYGLYRSTDEGVSWTYLNYFDRSINYIIEINNYILIASFNGIHKSYDEGLTRTFKLQIVFVSSIDTSSNNEIFASTESNGIYKSTNAGENWLSLSSFNFGQVTSVNVAINGYIFATTLNGSIYRSTNNGSGFEDLSNITPIYKTSYCVTTKDGYLYCGTFYQGIWSSSDFGNTWTKQYLGERVNFFIRKLCEGTYGNVFASVTGNGAIRTTDHGEHWNGFGFRESYARVDFLLKASDGKILSSTSQTSTDNGLNWVYSDYVFQPNSYAINEKDGNIYATDKSSNNSKNSLIFKSSNNGKDWTSIDLNKLCYWIESVYVSRMNNIYLSALGGGLFRSSNKGNDWVNLSTTNTRSINEDNLGYVFGKRTGGLFRSTNNGQSWENVLPLSDINGAIYSAYNGDIYSGGNGTLFKSTNNGANWTQENITGQVSSIVENESGRIFIGILNVGVFMKTGDDWVNITYNLGNTKVNSLCFNSAGQLLAGTDAGVFRSHASVISVNELNQNSPDEFTLNQNYPNPFNPSTFIRYSIPSNVRGQMSNVKLIVYNNLGMEIKTLINETKPAGYYEIEFDGSDLSSGIYFYKLSTDSFTETKRMLLLK